MPFAPSLFYQNRLVCLATKHGKERAIARPFRKALGLVTQVPADLDTDAMGTFSGEISRQGTPVEVCMEKARLGMAATGLSLGLANEGSFGPHPFIPWIASDLEVMVFIDNDRGFSIHEMQFSEKTNYARCEVSECGELREWFEKVRFPSHGLLVRPKSEHPKIAVEKGIVRFDQLHDAIGRAASYSEEALAVVETDMRAHFNPLRMAVIRRLAFKLARRLATPCPACAAPGWGMTDQSKGLPCEACGTATEMILAEIFTCTHCVHREERPRLDDLREAPAGRCPLCNP